jgi:hypothetical protein
MNNCEGCDWYRQCKTRSCFVYTGQERCQFPRPDGTSAWKMKKLRGKEKRKGYIEGTHTHNEHGRGKASRDTIELHAEKTRSAEETQRGARTDLGGIRRSWIECTERKVDEKIRSGKRIIESCSPTVAPEGEQVWFEQ